MTTTGGFGYGLPTKKDFKAHQVLRNSIREGRCLAFVGAGMSARAGFSDWSNLLRDLAGKATGKTQRRRLDVDSILAKDMSWRAEEIRDLIPNEEVYFKILSKHFNQAGKQDAAIDAFAKLKFRHFFTTNYDLSLETALRRHLAQRRPVEAINWLEPRSPSKVMRSFGESGDNKAHIVYLHGKADVPKTIVLSERDYQAQYVRSDETVRKLFAIFSMRQVAFFGFSLEDIDLLSIFRQVRAANEEALHFAVIPDAGPDDRERIRARFINKYGIHPIFYDRGGPGHPNLLPLIEGLDADASSTTTSDNSNVRRRLSSNRKWIDTEDFRTGEYAADPDDPQKGRFGGLASRNGRKLSARVTPSEDGGQWFDLEIEVVPTNGKPITGSVGLWVHDSFPRKYYSTQAHKGRAKFSFSVFGAFTIGAVVDKGKTPLELDLSRLPNAPDKFLTS